jgi:DNA invertase Pin-like site-specific DNA recombinase
METTKKAFGYLRVSGKGQIEGDGFARQRAAIETHAQANGITISQWFEERGVSGTKDLDNRPALQALILALHSNGVKTVIIEKLDRLARDLMVQETIIGDIRKSGFELVSVAEPDLCSDDPSRTLVRQVFGAIAQYEKTMLVSKLRGARQRKHIQTGRCEGRKPYGTRVGEQDIIAKIKSLHASGSNYEAIAKQLNAEGVQTRKLFGAWYPSGVRNIILKSPQA